MPITPPPDLIEIPGYRVLRTVSVGPRSTVFEALRETGGDRVALKVFNAAHFDDKRRERFFQEANILLRLKHRGIARFHQTGMCRDGEENRYFHVIEWIDGLPILEYAAGHGLKPRPRLELLMQACEVVAYIHRKKVLHRNLRPENILVDSGGQPKLIDFGLARLTQGMPKLTAPGQIVGSLPYMSPEQARGNPDNLDERLDVYALAGIGYALMAGRPPLDFQGKSLAEALKMVLEAEPDPLGAANPAFQGELERIFTRALDKDKSRRPSSVEEFAAEIEQWLRGWGG